MVNSGRPGAHSVGSIPTAISNYKINNVMRAEVKEVLIMVLLGNISLNDINDYPSDVIDEASFYLGEAFDLLMTAYE